MEWWCFEAIILLAGRLPQPEVAIDIVGICVNIATTTFMFPFGLAGQHLTHWLSPCCSVIDTVMLSSTWFSLCSCLHPGFVRDLLPVHHLLSINSKHTVQHFTLWMVRSCTQLDAASGDVACMATEVVEFVTLQVLLVCEYPMSWEQAGLLQPA